MMTQGIFIRLPEELAKKLAEVCQTEGYKKSRLIEKAIRRFLTEREEKNPILEAARFGIDLSLLRANLDKSPTERLRHHAEVHCFVERLRKAGSKQL